MRRFVAGVVSAVLLVAGLAACSDDGGGSGAASTVVPTTVAPDPADAATAATIRGIVEQQMAAQHLKAAIVKVTIAGREVLRESWGTSMTGVPATADMRFRNGAVAISYMSTLLLRLSEQGVVGLDDPVARWRPEIPHADEVTLRQLAAMTSGYRDYVPDPGFQAATYQDPFRQWTPEELVAIGAPQPLWYAPGTNWNYAHTNYVILGLALETATGKPLDVLLREQVLDPLGLDATLDPGTPAVPEPVLHTFSGERAETLGVPAGTRFFEESTFWNPSWTLARGAIQVTDIDDMARSAVGLGSGELLSPASYAIYTSTAQRNFGGPVDGCPSCRRGNDSYTYGLGTVIKGDWLLQNPAFFGHSGVMAYLPSQRIGIALVVTNDEAYYRDPSVAANPSVPMFVAIGTALAPGDAPPA